MSGDSCMMEKTFFADKSDYKKESILNQKDETKNSSNPEIVLKELDTEINHFIKANNINPNHNLSNSSNSRTVDPENNCGDCTPLFLNGETWRYDEAQDSNQFDNAYTKLRNVRQKVKNKVYEKIHVKTDKMNLSKKKEVKNIENSPSITECDCNEDLDEFSENLDKNKINTINMKYNDINMIDNKNRGQYSYKKNICITEPDNFIDPISNTTIHGMHNRNLSSSLLHGGVNKMFNNINYNLSNLTPNKNKVIPFPNYTLTPRNLTFHKSNNFGVMNNNLIFNNNQINHPSNFGNMMMYKNTTGSFISQSNYSGSNKMRGENYENEESTEIGDYSHEEGPNSHRTTNSNSNTYQYSVFNNNLSAAKIRIPTQESVESVNSANQFQYSNLNNQSNQNIYSNLCPQIPKMNTPNSNSNALFNSEELFGTNVNNEQQNYYLMTNNNINNLDNAFSLNHNSSNLIGNSGNRISLRSLNRHTLSESTIQLHNDLYKIILDDILYGKDGRTTLMIRNIPIRYNDEMLLKELEEFDGKFDCLYLPFDFMQNGNRGYAFINFVHPFHILLFYDKFEGKPWNLFESKKICELNYARFQGINEIKKHSVRYRGSKKPVFFNNFDFNEKIEIPKQYLNKLKQKTPNIQWEPGQFGGIKINL